MRLTTSSVDLRSYCLTGLGLTKWVGKASQDTEKDGKGLWEFNESTTVGGQQNCEMAPLENAHWRALDPSAMTGDEV